MLFEIFPHIGANIINFLEFFSITKDEESLDMKISRAKKSAIVPIITLAQPDSDDLDIQEDEPQPATNNAVNHTDDNGSRNNILDNNGRGYESDDFDFMDLNYFRGGVNAQPDLLINTIASFLSG